MLGTKFLRIQINTKQKQKVIERANSKGFKTLSSYIRARLLRNDLNIKKLKEIKENLKNGPYKRYKN